MILQSGRLEQQAVRERIYQAFLRILSDSREQGAYWHELCLGALREVLLLLAKQQNNGLTRGLKKRYICSLSGCRRQFESRSLLEVLDSPLQDYRIYSKKTQVNRLWRHLTA